MPGLGRVVWRLLSRLLRLPAAPSPRCLCGVCSGRAAEKQPLPTLLAAGRLVVRGSSGCHRGRSRSGHLPPVVVRGDDQDARPALRCAAARQPPGHRRRRPSITRAETGRQRAITAAPARGRPGFRPGPARRAHQPRADPGAPDRPSAGRGPRLEHQAGRRTGPGAGHPAVRTRRRRAIPLLGPDRRAAPLWSQHQPSRRSAGRDGIAAR
jgi:hypothetical protein